MGLRQKIVRILVVVFFTYQVLASPSIPRNHSKCPLKNINNNPFSENKRTKTEQLCNNSTTDTSNIRFPNVEYPYESEPEEYYRFLNEYPLQLEFMNNSHRSCQGQICKMESKYKRKIDMVANAKSKPEVPTSVNKYDDDPQVYCFRKSGFFPEVEYPLSTRDMWIPNYWSRLQDVKNNNDVGINPCINKQTLDTNYTTDYENSRLKTLIKVLNTKKVQIPETSNMTEPDLKITNFKTTQINSSVHNMETIGLTFDTQNKNDSSTAIMTHSSVNTEVPISEESTFDAIEHIMINIDNDDPTSPGAVANESKDNSVLLTDASANSKSESVILKPSSSSKLKSKTANISMADGNMNGNAMTMTNTTTDSYYQPKLIITNEADQISNIVDSSNTSVAVPDGTELSGTEKTATHDSAIQTDWSPSCFPHFHETSTQSSDNITTTSQNNEIYTPFDYYDSTGIMNLDTSDMTTVAAFDNITSSMSPTDDAEVISTVQYDNSDMVFTTVSTTEMPVITTKTPSCLDCLPNVTYSNYDYLIVTDVYPHNLSDSDLSDLTKDWVLTSNDSCITSQFPDNSDDWIIYVDAENTSLCLGNLPDDEKLSEGENIFTTSDSSASINTPRESPFNMHDAQDLFISNITNAVTIGPETPDSRNVDINSFDDYKSDKDIYENSTSVIVPSIPMYLDYSCIVNYDIENSTHSKSVDEYVPVAIVVGNGTNETYNTIDELLYFDNINSSSQYEYLDDTMLSVTEIPYDFVLSPENINGFINDSSVFHDTTGDCRQDGDCLDNTERRIGEKDYFI